MSKNKHTYWEILQNVLSPPVQLNVPAMPKAGGLPDYVSVGPFACLHPAALSLSGRRSFEPVWGSGSPLLEDCIFLSLGACLAINTNGNAEIISPIIYPKETKS